MAIKNLIKTVTAQDIEATQETLKVYLSGPTPENQLIMIAFD